MHMYFQFGVLSDISDRQWISIQICGHLHCGTSSLNFLHGMALQTPGLYYLDFNFFLYRNTPHRLFMVACVMTVAREPLLPERHRLRYHATLAQSYAVESTLYAMHLTPIQWNTLQTPQYAVLALLRHQGGRGLTVAAFSSMIYAAAES